MAYYYNLVIATNIAIGHKAYIVLPLGLCRTKESNEISMQVGVQVTHATILIPLSHQQIDRKMEQQIIKI